MVNTTSCCLSGRPFEPQHHRPLEIDRVGCVRAGGGWDVSRYHDVMTKQTTVRLPDDLAADAEAVARVRGGSVNQLIIDSLAAEIARVRADDDFTARAKQLLERDREILDRLAK